MSFATVPLHYAEVQVADIPTFQQRDRLNFRFKCSLYIRATGAAMSGQRPRNRLFASYRLDVTVVPPERETDSRGALRSISMLRKIGIILNRNRAKNNAV